MRRILTHSSNPALYAIAAQRHTKCYATTTYCILWANGLCYFCLVRTLIDIKQWTLSAIIVRYSWKAQLFVISKYRRPQTTQPGFVGLPTNSKMRAFHGSIYFGCFGKITHCFCCLAERRNKITIVLVCNWFVADRTRAIASAIQANTFKINTLRPAWTKPLYVMR